MQRTTTRAGANMDGCRWWSVRCGNDASISEMIFRACCCFWSSFRFWSDSLFLPLISLSLPPLAFDFRPSVVAFCRVDAAAAVRVIAPDVSFQGFRFAFASAVLCFVARAAQEIISPLNNLSLYSRTPPSLCVSFLRTNPTLLCYIPPRSLVCII